MGKYTKEQLARGFEEWMIQERVDSNQFMDKREKAELTPKEYGILSADCLVELIAST